MDHNLTFSIKSEFLALIQGTRNYLSYRKEISAHDLGLSEESIAILKSWDNKGVQSIKAKPVPTSLRGEGDPHAALFIVTEHKQSGVSPYEGEAGELFLKILSAIDLARETVYITAIPGSGPMSGVLERIKREINVVKPRVILTLGRRAAQTMLETKSPLPDLRGRFHNFNEIALMPTFHPLTLMEDISKKRPVWEDMKMVKKRLGL